MAAKAIVPPFPILMDTDGSPLNNGYVYIGTLGLNPETYPITTYWDVDLVYAAQQPIRTINGYLSRNGTPGMLFADADDYSITVRNKHGAIVYTSLNSGASPVVQLESDLVDFIQAGTGAVTRTGQAKMRDVINVKDFGAVGDGVTDDTAAIQAAIDSIDKNNPIFTGGVIYIPMGEYMISSAIYIRDTHASHLASVTIRGDGINNTKIKCDSSFTDNDALYVQHANYCVIEDLHIDGAGKSVNGLYIEDGSGIVINRVFAQNNTGSGFKIFGASVITMSHCRSENPNGACDFDFSGGYNSAMNIENCHALDTAGTGFKVIDVAHSVFTACSCDDADIYAYEIRNVVGVSFISCGAVNTGRAAFHVSASAANDTASTINGTRCSITNCFSDNADIDLAGYGSIFSTQVDTSVIDVLVERFMELTNAGAVSVVTDGVALDHRLKIVDCSLLEAITGVGALLQESNVIKTDAISITGAGTPVTALGHIGNNTNNYFSGLLHIIATNGSYIDSDTRTASYVLLITIAGYGTTIIVIASDGHDDGYNIADPSFTWTYDVSTKYLKATPIGSTSGTFYFYITSLGGMTMSNV